jgi:hypothetical protein
MIIQVVMLALDRLLRRIVLAFPYIERSKSQEDCHSGSAKQHHKISGQNGFPWVRGVHDGGVAVSEDNLLGLGQIVESE